MFKSRVLIASFAVVAAAPVLKTAADPPATPPAPAVSAAPPLLPPPPPPPSAILGVRAPTPTPTLPLSGGGVGNNGAPSAVAPPPTAGMTTPAAASQARAVDWPMLGGSDLRYNAYPTGVDTTRLALSWQYAIPGDAETTIAPVAANGVVYVTAGSSVYALNAETGEQIWPAPFATKSLEAGLSELPAISSSPAYANGYLFVGAVNGILYVLDATTGKVVQALPTGSSVTSSPTITHGLVVVATEGGTALAFSLPAPGRPMTRAWITPLSPTDAISGAAAVARDTIYFTTDAGKAFGLNVRTGIVQAGAQSEGASFRFGPLPTAAGIFAVSGRKLYLLNSFGLRQSWVQSFPDDIAAQPAFSNGVFYLVLVNGDLFAFSPERRTALWSVSLGANSSPKATPLVAGSSIIVPTANGHV
ncbi:MAG: PQQ-binding-like beta-propeller repeat protein, partial [Armatimonadota bacterium]|nr:PQQ-binding-like beta-propeller repeat protein [Armatimonadota bacterium]